METPRSNPPIIFMTFLLAVSILGASFTQSTHWRIYGLTPQAIQAAAKSVLP